MVYVKLNRWDFARNRKKSILRYLYGLSYPMKSRHAYMGFEALNPEYECSYRTWKRELVRLANVNVLDLKTMKGGVGGCHAVIQKMY